MALAAVLAKHLIKALVFLKFILCVTEANRSLQVWAQASWSHTWEFLYKQPQQFVLLEVDSVVDWIPLSGAQESIVSSMIIGFNCKSPRVKNQGMQWMNILLQGSLFNELLNLFNISSNWELDDVR